MIKPGEEAYIIESNRIVRKVTVVRYSGGMVVVRFCDTGGGTQISRNRLYTSEEEANKKLQENGIAEQKREPERKTIYDYGM